MNVMARRGASSAASNVERMFAAERTEPLCECDDCGRRYAYDRRQGHTKRRCNSCRSNKGPKGRADIKRRMVAYKGGRCELCGYARCQRALCFHHLDGSKRFNVAGSHTRSWESLRAELDRCVLLCHNCHQEVHHGLAAIAATRV